MQERFRKKKEEDMRLDKFLVECGLGSRREVKELLKNKKVQKNGFCVTSPEEKVDEKKDRIEYENQILEYKEFRYYIMNKKAGYITSLGDARNKTVIELLPNWVIQKDLTPVGRLDKDTEGLLLFTNHGKLNHKLLSPKSHVEKVYEADLEEEIAEEELKKLREGVDIGDYITLPAKVVKQSSKKISLNIQEGKFHQVKKMLEAVGNKVIYLKRVSFGNLTLGDLALGEVREICLEHILGKGQEDESKKH